MVDPPDSKSQLANARPVFCVTGVIRNVPFSFSVNPWMALVTLADFLGMFVAHLLLSFSI